MDSLTSRLGTRFLVVTVVPNMLLFSYIGFLFAAGAPTHPASLARAIKVLNGLSIREIVASVLVVLIISFVTHPLQTPLIRLAEGYWHGLPFGSTVAAWFTVRFQNELRQSRDRGRGSGSWGSAAARRRREWLPPRRMLLPTVLGNTLWKGEHTAGARYGLVLERAWPRLSLLLSASCLNELRDRRNQLDSAAQFCFTAGIATVAGICLLTWHESWLFLPFVTYVLCWVSYRAAIAAAQSFSGSLAAAVDLHHLQLFDALQLKRPADLAEERDLNIKLDFLFRYVLSDEGQMREFRYVATGPDESPAQGSP
jgi:hypothetical protein